MVKDEWLPDNGLATPTLKIKRAKIDERFSQSYDIGTNQKMMLSGNNI